MRTRGVPRPGEIIGFIDVPLANGTQIGTISLIDYQRGWRYGFLFGNKCIVDAPRL